VLHQGFQCRRWLPDFPKLPMSGSGCASGNFAQAIGKALFQFPRPFEQGFESLTGKMPFP
jgi:hypothetical protein